MSSDHDAEWRPRLRESIIVQRDAGELLFLFSSSRLVKRFSVDDLVIRALPQLDGTKTVAELAEALGGDPVSTAEDLRTMLSVLEEEKILSKVSDHSSSTATDLVTNADVVINAADQPSPNSVSAWVADACWRAAVPHIMGSGYSYNMGILGTTILPGETACWGCVRAETFTDHGRDRSSTLIGRREFGGALGPLSGTVGNILAWEGIRILAGLPTGLAGQWAELDCWPLQVRTRAIPRRSRCPCCGDGAA